MQGVWVLHVAVLTLIFLNADKQTEAAVMQL